MRANGPLQDAWAREVQRRHMDATIRHNRGRRQQAQVSTWHAFEQSLQPLQRRFAQFEHYGWDLGEVPQAVVDDLRNHFDVIHASRAAEAAPSTQPSQASSAMQLERLAEKRAVEVPIDECSICLQIVAAHARVKVLPCGHAFHGACIARWLQRSDLCPVCRAALPASTASSSAAT